MTTERFVSLYQDLMHDLREEGVVYLAMREKALAFALTLLAEDDLFYGSADSLANGNLLGHGTRAYVPNARHHGHRATKVAS